MRMVRKSTALLLAVLMLLTSFSCLTAFADTAAEDVFTKVTSIADITAGDEYVLVLNGGDGVGDIAVKGSVASKTLASDATVTIANDSITAPDASITWTLEASNGNYKLKNVGSEKYLDWTSSTTPAMAADGEELTITANDDGTFKFVVVDSTSNGRFLAYYPSGSGFRWYNSGSYNGDFFVYKKSAGGSPSERGTIVYFTNSLKWAGTIYAHAWNSTDTDKVSGEWGKTDPVATKVETNEYGQDVYSYAMSSEFDSVIFYGFNNNSTTGQTIDVTLDDMGENNGFYALSETDTNGAHKVDFYKIETAAPVENYTVIIGSNDDDNCLVGNEGGEYEDGTVIDLEVLLISDGYVFNGWYQLNDDGTETLLGTSESMTYTVNSDAMIEARVGLPSTDGYDVIVDAGKNGILLQDPTSEGIAYGTILAAEALANEGYEFDAWVNGDGEVLSTENPYTFTVTGETEMYATYKQTAVVSTGYTKITSVSDIATDGSEYIIVLADKALAITSDLKTVAVNAENDSIEAIDAAAVWTIEATYGGFALKNTSLDTNEYLYYSGSGTTAAMKSEFTTVELLLNDSNNFEIKVSGGERYLGYYATGDVFRWYAASSSNPHEYVIYKKPIAAPIEDTTIYFTNNKNWTGDILVYAWSSETGDDNGDWGTVSEATKAVNTGKTNEYGQEIYSFVLKAGYDMFIFYVNGGDQTTNINIIDTIRDGNNAIYLDDIKDDLGHYIVGYWKFSTEEPAPVKAVVELLSSDQKMGTVSATAPADEKDYYVGEEVTITAHPEDGYRFVKWLDSEDEVASTKVSFTITLTGDVQYTAVFEEITETSDKVYGKVSGSDITAGSYVFVLAANESALTNDKSATFMSDLDSTITNPAASIVWELENGTEEGTFTLKNGTKYIKFASAAFSLDASAATDITVEATDNGTVKLKGINTGNAVRYIGFNSTFKLLAASSTYPAEFYAYKLNATPAEDEERTIYLTDNHNWGTIRAYAYLSTAGSDDNGAALVQNAAFAEAPVMTFAKQNSEGQNVYAISLSKKYDTVIFHNGEGAQSVNITIADIFADGNDSVWLGGMTESGYSVGGYWSFNGSEKVEAVVDVESADVSMGTVAIEPAAEVYYVGDEITFKATALDGYHFVNWTDVDDNEASTSASYKVVLKGDVLLIANFAKDEDPVEKSYGRITELSQITTGASDEYILVFNGGEEVGDLAVSGTITSSTLVGSAIADLGDIITAPAADIVWKIEASGDNYILKNVSADKYLDWSKSTTPALVEDSTAAEILTISANDDETFKFTVVNTTETTARFLAYNKSNGFRWYNSSSYNGNFSLYKLGATAPVASNTVYLTDNHNWGTIRAYAFATDAKGNVVENAAFAEAPVMELFATNDMNQNIYTINIPETYTTVIFHNGNNAQTVDIKVADILAKGNNALWLADAVDGKYTVGGYYFYGEVEVTEVSVSVKSEDKTMGTVTVDPVAEKYYTGDEITVTATAADGYVFEGWYGADGKKIDGAAADYAIVLSEDVDLTAKFIEESAKPTGTFVKVTDASEITTGCEYVFILKDKAVALTNELKSIALAETSADTIVNPSAELVWNYVAGTDMAALMNSDGKYLAGTSTITRVDSLDAASAIVFTANDDGTFVLVNNTANKKAGYYESSSQFKWYALSNSNPDDFYIYKKSVPSTTVYITNNHSWESVKVYAYTTDGETTSEYTSFAESPAAALVFTNEQGQDVYSITVPNEFETIVIHDGNGSQTVNISIADIVKNDNNAVWIDSTKDSLGHYNVGGYWAYAPVTTVYYKLTATSADKAQGTVTVDPESEDSKYAAGTKVTLTAEAAEGYAFEGWYIDDTVVDGAKAVYELTVDKDVAIEARFVLESQVDRVFNRVTEVSEGNYVLVMDNDGTLISYTNTNSATAVTSSTTVTNPADGTVITLTAADNDQYYITCNGEYMRIASSKIEFTTDKTLATLFSIVAGKTDGTFSIQAAVDSETLNKKIGYLVKSDAFKPYALSNSNPYEFYFLKENAPTPVDPDEPETFKTIYFTNNRSWTGDILVYAWNTETNANNGEWGTASEATKAVNTGEKNDMGQEIYSFSLSSKYDKVIFYVNNGEQTTDISVADITADGNNAVYLLDTKDTDGHYNVGYWTKAQKFTVTVNDCDEGGLVIGSSDQYAAGDTITLEALADEGYRFVGWFLVGSDKAISTEDTYVYEVTGDAVIEGRFELIPVTKYTVTVKDNENGGIIIGSTAEYADGDKIKLEAVAEKNYSFVGWYLEGSDKPFSTDAECTYTVTGDAVIEGRFERMQVTYDILVDTPDNGTIDKNGDYTVNEGEMFTVSVVGAAEGYKFAGWVDLDSNVLSTETTYSFVVNADAYINAIFKKLHTVSVSSADTAAGTVSNSVSDTNSFYVDDNESFTLVASAKTGYEFAGWVYAGTTAVISKDTSFTTSVTEDKQYVATFNRLPVTGDVNGDYAVTSADLTLVQNYLAGTGTLTAAQKTAADVNNDGNVNLMDAYIIYTLMN